MTHENYELGKKMLDYARLKDYDLQIGEKSERIYYITYKGERLYELWEMSSLWSVSTMEKQLIKKHEDFYFAFKFIIEQVWAETMDAHFGKHEDTYKGIEDLES
jgi:hypothetical protein